MTKIDIVSGFLGAGKTTLIKKMVKEAYQGEKLVLIENEFGEISIDGGFLKDAGIQISEMSSGCICCSLVGDFGKALREVKEQFQPDRILIENREERDGFVGDEVAHMDGGDRFRIHIFFLSIPCLVVCAAVKHDAPLRSEKLFSKPTELFAVVSVMINSFQCAEVGCVQPTPAQIILAYHFVVFAFRLSPLPWRDGAARLCG